jgi:hypothetical protein
MKARKTENRKQEIGSRIIYLKKRGKSRNYGQEKFILLILLLLHFFQLDAKPDYNNNRWQLTISSGIHSFYAPVENLKWDNPGFVASTGINRMLGKKQLFSLGLQFQYDKNRYQGDATSFQFLGQFLPVILKKMELGIGTGIGYRFSAYPSTPLKWSGDSWEKRKMVKGIIQVPLLLSTGYRSVQILSLAITPFISYQMQAMFGYNPDFEPLPDSNLMFGFKFK